jgi:hypothetical protein
MSRDNATMTVMRDRLVATKAEQAEVVRLRAALRVSLTWSSLGYLVESVGSPALERNVAHDPVASGGVGGQGFVADADRRRAIEDRAMELAKAWYVNDGWSVTDVSRTNPETEGTPSM